MTDKVINIPPPATPEEQEAANNEFTARYSKQLQIKNYEGETIDIVYFTEKDYIFFEKEAEKLGVTPEEMFAEMQKMLQEAYNDGYKEGRAEILQSKNISRDLILATDNYALPFGPYLFVLMEAIEHTGTDRKLYPNLTAGGRKKNNRNILVNVEPYGENGFTLTHRNKNARTSITILNKELIKSTSVIKLFVFLLAKSAQQNFNPVIYFSLEELVNIGMYSNINNARAGFKNHILAIQSIQIAGEVKKYADKKNKGNIKQSGRVLFTGYDLYDNGVKVEVNPNFDIEYLAGYYAMIPNWAFSLSDRGFNLLIYIMLLARTNRRKQFNIGFEQIRERLALPTKKEYDDINKHIKEDNENLPPEKQKPLKKFKPQQYVKTPIKSTIEEINNSISINECDYLEIQPHYEDTAASIDQWLKDSYLKVKVKGDLAAQITGHIEKQKAIIERNAERKAAIIDSKTPK